MKIKTAFKSQRTATLYAVVLAVVSSLTFGCRSSHHAVQNSPATAKVPWYADMAALESQLAKAIDDARDPNPTHISHTLMPVRQDYPGQEWTVVDDRPMVLVTTLVDSSRLKRFFSGDGAYRINREMGTWVTLPADWQRKHAIFQGLDSIAAHMRMVQLYGLSPDCDYTLMVSFYADPEGMFRPAADPDITTTTVGFDFPAYADDNLTIGETHFREWFRYSYAGAYEDDTPLPWTRLGYTYDWHPGASREGLSEYIVGHNTLIKVKHVETAWQFIQNLSKHKR